MKSGFVSLIGRPNVGKSTLMNALIGQKIAITSDRPQTTRNKIETVYTDDRGQIVFLDTPGIHKAKNKLGEFMDRKAEEAFSESDVICWLVEPTTYIGAGEERIAGLLKTANKKHRPVILIVNKTDTLKKKEDIEEVIQGYEAVADFDEICCVSAETGDNLDDLLDVLFYFLHTGPQYYDDDVVTTIPMRTMAEELIREQALKFLSDEIPHGMAVIVNRYNERSDGIVDIEADLVCEKDSHKGIVIGKGGAMIKKIGTGARAEIEDQLEGQQVNLKLFVKVRKNWRDNEGLMRSYGYKA